MKRNMTATVMALAMSTVMTAAVLSGCSSTPKETAPETAKEQQTEQNHKYIQCYNHSYFLATLNQCAANATLIFHMPLSHS